MKRSTERIRTTHTGSLHRPESLARLMFDKEDRKPVDRAALEREIRAATVEVLRRQVEAGIDVVSDGEVSKASFVTYINDRLRGFDAEHAVGFEGFLPQDLADFPGLIPRVFAEEGHQHIRRLACTGPVSYADVGAIDRDIETFAAARREVSVDEAFMTAVSPGTVDMVSPNRHYATSEEYHAAIAEALRLEYEAITGAGLVLQVDCPDFAMGRHVQFADASLEEFRRVTAMRVEVLNHALAKCPTEQVRIHLCWGNYAGPHHRDVPLREIIDLVFAAKASAFSIEMANPRHEHEWKLFEDVKLPEGAMLIAGVLDVKTNWIEHPELIADRLVRLGRVVGRENLMATTDCGFGTFAGTSPVHTDVAYAKLAAMAEGARLASRGLW